MRFEYPGVPRDQARRMKRLFKADDESGYASALEYLLRTKQGTALLRRVFGSNGVTSIADLEALARHVAHVMRNAPSDDDEHDSFQPWPDAKPEVTEKGFPHAKSSRST
jgi:hypothetical protein